MNESLNRTGIIYLANKSGGLLPQGAVGIVDPATAASFTTIAQAGYVDGIIVVVMEPAGIANNAVGLVAYAGRVPKINLSSSASLGDLVATHSVAGQGAPHAAPWSAGDFAQVLDIGTTPAAMLFPNPYIASSPPEFVWFPALTPDANTNWSSLVADGSIVSSGAQNDQIEWDVFLESGTYTFCFSTVKDTNRGVYHLLLDTVDVETEDGYGAVAGQVLTFSGHVITTGVINIALKMATKNASASNYYGVVFEAWAKRTGA